MSFKPKWYVHADKEGLEKIARLLRRDKFETLQIMCVDKVIRECILCNYAQFRHVERQYKYLRVNALLLSNQGHGVRPWIRSAH